MLIARYSIIEQFDEAVANRIMNKLYRSNLPIQRIKRPHLLVEVKAYDIDDAIKLFEDKISSQYYHNINIHKQTDKQDLIRLHQYKGISNATN